MRLRIRFNVNKFAIEIKISFRVLSVSAQHSYSKITLTLVVCPFSSGKFNATKVE